jgi:hypothetical protein
MREIYRKYKAWKLEKIRRWAQWYADFIIKRLEESQTDWEFEFWLMKGYDHNLVMINKYDIYLD